MPVGSTPAAINPPAATNARSNAIALLNAWVEIQPPLLLVSICWRIFM
jgi:hypothetical protein